MVMTNSTVNIVLIKQNKSEHDHEKNEINLELKEIQLNVIHN